MKRLPRKTAKRLFWALLIVMLAVVLATALFPSAQAALWIVLVVLFAAVLAIVLICFRCPECGAQLRLEDKFCSKCGAKLEEEP